MKLEDLKKAIPFETEIEFEFFHRAVTEIFVAVLYEPIKIVTLNNWYGKTTLSMMDFKPGTPLKEGLTLFEAVESGEDYKRLHWNSYITGGGNQLFQRNRESILATDYILKPKEVEKKTRMFTKWIMKNGSEIWLNFDLKNPLGDRVGVRELTSITFDNQNIEVDW